MRIAIVSPYSWSYPGGVTRHIEALAERFIEDGHYVRVLAPFDPTDRVSTVLHRGAAPQPVSAPDYLVSLGRTLGFKANGAVSNVSITPHGVATMHKELRTGGYDVVHVHEPIAPVLSWIGVDNTRLPMVGTFHVYSQSKLSNGIANMLGARRVLNRLHVRIAVSEAAAWTARRFFGGHYEIIPNGVHVDAQRAALAAKRPHGRPPADRVRRPSGRAQGPAAAAARVRGPARAHPDRADGDRADAGGARADDARLARRADPGQGRRRDQAPRARGGGRAVRAVTGR